MIGVTLSNLIQQFCQKTQTCATEFEVKQLHQLSDEITACFRTCKEDECDFEGYKNFKKACKRLDKAESKIAELSNTNLNRKIEREQATIQIQLEETQRTEWRICVSQKISQIERNLGEIHSEIKAGNIHENLEQEIKEGFMQNFTDLVDDLHLLKSQLTENKILSAESVEFWLKTAEGCDQEIAAISEFFIKS